MTVPLALMVFAASIMLTGPWLLTRGGWTHTAPRSGILAWQSSVAAVLTAFVLLALTAVLPVERVSFDVAHLLHACAGVLQNRYALFQAGWVPAVSVTVAVLTAVLLLRALVVLGVGVFRGRARQRRLIDLLARERDGFGVHVLTHDVPLAYCIPGGRGRIVLTTAAKTQLDEQALAAVVAHEQAHLRGRHDLVLFGADVARTAFPWSRFFKVAHEQMSGLVEMLADDRAARQTGSLPLATALLDLGVGTAPSSTLAASSHLTTERVMRLVDGVPRRSLLQRAGVGLLSLTLVTSPWVIAIAPAWAARSGGCPPV